MILIVSCSDSKHPLLQKGRARDIYTGPLTSLSIKYAELMGYKPYILSGKYGIISPDQIIETYDQRLRRPYTGKWPEQTGFWIGGKEYFKYAPNHIERYFPEGTSYCQMKSFLNKAVNPHRYGKVG